MLLLLLRDRVPASWLSCLRSSATAKDDPLTASSTSTSTAPGHKSVAAALDNDINASLGVSRRREQFGEDAATGFDVWMRDNQAADEAEAAAADEGALELATLGNSAAPPAQEHPQPQLPLQPPQVVEIAEPVELAQVDVVNDSVSVAAANDLASPSRFLHVAAEPFVRRTA